MKTTFALLLLLLLGSPISLQAHGVNPGSVDRLKLAVLFAKGADHGGTVTIPPGDYYLDGTEPIPLASRTTVFAYGTRFHLPVDGTNGSRVISVEKSCEDVTIVGNTFRNGGRGSWINQPRNFVLADNIFVNNTTKCEQDPRRGRRSFVTGDYEEYAELYFTTHEPDGRYGNVTVRGNIFSSGDKASHAITFAPGGDTLLLTDNIFQGKVRTIAPATGCTNVTVRQNVGATFMNETNSP